MAPPRFQKLVIYGVGLLGGSLGMALRRRAMAAEIVGLGRSQERLERARQFGAIDRGSTRAAEALEGADAVILAVPPRQIRERLAEIGPHLAPGTFLTDVGSVKARIVEEARRAIPPGVLYIGSHPMAGSEKAGVEYSRGDFYEGCACILTPDDSTDPQALAIARSFWEALGARVIEMDPARHDRLLAGISHLPHLLASALMQSLARSSDLTADEVAAISGQGLKDMTRIAAADPEIWRQIFSENSDAVLAWLDDLEKVLNEWRHALTKNDGKTIEALFTEGSDARRKLEMKDET
ncbi:prephenate dehydrogenase/arogenate dehydrogenase family protein [bacterium]|nr:prephenate dehydrogenase/arogenate dehydrogenase family protein [bacterium]